jgi:hypothetical protein
MVFQIGRWWYCGVVFSLGSIVCGAELEDRGRRWSGFVLHGAFCGDVKSCLADRCYDVSYLVGRCYARQIFQNLRVWTDERGAVASTDGRTGKDDADLFSEDGSVVR